jgi:hypothetical protein
MKYSSHTRRLKHSGRRPSLALIAAVLAIIGTVVVVARQSPAGAIPQGSAPDLYVAGSGGAAEFPFAGDNLGAETGAQHRAGLNGAADTSTGTQTVVIGRNGHTPTVFVVGPATGATSGSIPLPGLPLVGVAADPHEADVAFVASENALYALDVKTLAAHVVYHLPKGTKSIFSSVAVAPSGSIAYLGGANSSSGHAINAIFAIKVAGAPAPVEEWVAPAGVARFSGEVTDLALTPNGHELFATNNFSTSPAAPPTTKTTATTQTTVVTQTTPTTVATTPTTAPTTQTTVPTTQTTLPTTATTAPTTTTQPQSSSSGTVRICGIACHICLVCILTTTTSLPVIQGPEVPATGTQVANAPNPPVPVAVPPHAANAPEAAFLVDAVAFGFRIPFHPSPPGSSRPVPPPGTPPDFAVPLPYPSVPAARGITVSPDGGDVFVGSTAGFRRSVPYLTGFPVANPAQFRSVALPSTNLGIEPGNLANVSIALSPDGHSLVAAVAGESGSGTDLDVVTVGPNGAAAPSMVPPASPSRVVDDGWPTSPQDVAITPDQSPVPHFTANMAPAGTGSTFDASASTVQFGTIASYDWSFGDGGSATGPTPTHVYTAPGTYTVRLCETDSEGLRDGTTVPGTPFRVDGPGQTPYWNSHPCLRKKLTVPPTSTTVTTPTTGHITSTPTTVKTTTTPTTAKTTTTPTTAKTTTTPTTRHTTTTVKTTTTPSTAKTTTTGRTTTGGTTSTTRAPKGIGTTTTPTTARTRTSRTGTTATGTTATGRGATSTTATQGSATTSAPSTSAPTTRAPTTSTGPPGTGTTSTRATTTTVVHAPTAKRPSLQLDPSLGPPGTLVTVTGRGFPRDRLVRILWSVSTGSVVTRTNSKGQLTATLMILVPDVLGPRDAKAKGFHAAAPFLVVSDTSQPGGNQANPIFRTEGP